DNCVYSLDGHAVAGELNASVEEKDSLAQVWHKRLGHISEAGLWKSKVESLGGKRVEAISRESDWGTVKKLRTDNGLEFCNRECKQLCIESGIARHLTVAGTPQQNGLAERMNITLIDKVRCLLIQSGLPKTFWAKATCTTAYLINRSPSIAIEKKTPMEMWSGHPNYQLARDREPKTRMKPLRFRDESNMSAYAFAAAEEEDTHEPLTYQEAVACEDSSKWKAAMKEKMDSPRKNKTWELVDHQAGQKLLDVKTAFLHENLKEVIYMRQPPGYKQGNKSPRQWYRRFDEYMLSNEFKRSSYDICVYYRSYAPGEYIYLLLYVDDMLIACKSKAEIGTTKSLLKREFDMKDLGEAKKILGMEIFRDRSRKILRMPLGGHFKLSLKDCPIRDCDVERMSKVPYANAVGSLMYLMVCTRPNIAYAVSIVSRYLANPGKSHWEAVKWILKYLRGTANVGLIYETNRNNHMDVTGFVDSDYAKDPDKGRCLDEGGTWTQVTTLLGVAECCRHSVQVVFGFLAVIEF
nr:hypothetical protein [Tanacetum cinerariifolium]